MWPKNLKPRFGTAFNRRTTMEIIKCPVKWLKYETTEVTQTRWQFLSKKGICMDCADEGFWVFLAGFAVTYIFYFISNNFSQLESFLVITEVFDNLMLGKDIQKTNLKPLMFPNHKHVIRFFTCNLYQNASTGFYFQNWNQSIWNNKKPNNIMLINMG